MEAVAEVPQAPACLQRLSFFPNGAIFVDRERPQPRSIPTFSFNITFLSVASPGQMEHISLFLLGPLAVDLF